MKIKKKILLGIVMVFTLMYPQSYKAQERLLPIYSVHTEDKVASLTFDCAWGADDMEMILNILREHDVKASFFVVGDWARKNPEIIKKIVEEGHDLGNHSNKHPHVTQLSKEKIKEDIRLAHQEIKRITGKDMDLYRPPYGEYNNDVIEAANECNYYTIQWDVDSLDWKEYGKSQLIHRVLTHKHLSPGSIILLHNGTKYTKDALDELIVGLKAKGFKLQPVSQMILRTNYTIDCTGRQYPNK